MIQWSRHCVTEEKMYDDSSHCNTKMKMFQSYYIREEEDSQPEIFCPSCAAVAMLQEQGGIDNYTEESEFLRMALSGEEREKVYKKLARDEVRTRTDS